ncbi:Uncharacterized conserved protein [Plasmopara halstedii]|uniref:Succinate dehydrogenase assembly factor 4, mitochondrial n=1 Tax=Plasmopara halstedii TaxID=4781 RepID=A0A0P1AEP2_PLAHL|nr:Uncharacterized conserved protein [Plasmopara halstedii]CEG39021.1 Uncharacterized conserved protein [Plasmopara halstedii]|eukprot:XP_024575390.1 Uncharacterized conserved protein [Plasmopara halstedii]
MALRKLYYMYTAANRHLITPIQAPFTDFKMQRQLRVLSADTQSKKFVALNSSDKPRITHAEAQSVTDKSNDTDDYDNEDAEETVVIDSSNYEIGGPTRGGKFKEPTRFGDWERKGRCSDF